MTEKRIGEPTRIEIRVPLRTPMTMEDHCLGNSRLNAADVVVVKSNAGSIDSRFWNPARIYLKPPATYIIDTVQGVVPINLELLQSYLETYPEMTTLPRSYLVSSPKDTIHELSLIILDARKIIVELDCAFKKITEIIIPSAPIEPEPHKLQ